MQLADGPTEKSPADTPEGEILLLCSRTGGDAGRTDRIRTLVRQGLDWEYLLRRASRQGVTPLLYQSLNASSADDLPPDVLETLRDRFQGVARHGLKLTAELLRLLALFERRKIGVIPYKGPTLALAAYGNIALRHFQDLDLLVRREDFAAARDLLIEEGYRPQFELDEAQQKSFLATGNELLFSRESDGTIVELHWEISPRYFTFPLDTELLWRQAGTMTLSGRPVGTIPVELLLLILAAHGAKHNWERLAWICDIAELIGHSNDIDWDRLFAYAEKLGSERMLLLALWLAHDLLGCALPEFALERIDADRTIDELAAAVRISIFSDVEYNPEVVKRSGFHMRSRERLRDRIRYGVGRALLPTTEDWDAVRLPKALAGWYPVLRPFRLALKHGLRLVRRLRS